MTVKDFFENFENEDAPIIRIVSDDGSGYFDMRIGYNCIDKNHFMWHNFMAMYGDYLVTEWCFDTEDIYKIITVYVKASDAV